jgi:hypothetical protein
MTAFVEECRREWKRLGVPDLLADEMAADLEADLVEAEADGVSAAEILGESDPRRFAATWASERGLVADQHAPKKPRRIWPWVVLAVVLLFGFFISFSLVGFGTGSVKSAPPELVTRQRRISVPNLVGMSACKAVRIAMRSGLDVRLPGHEHGYGCDLVVDQQTPAPRETLRRNGTLTLRLGRN